MTEARKSPTFDSLPPWLRGLAERWRVAITAGAVIVATVISLLGIRETADNLENRVVDLEHRTRRIEAIDQHIGRLQAQVRQISKVRGDILEGICVAVADRPADVRRCLDGH